MIFLSKIFAEIYNFFFCLFIYNSFTTKQSGIYMNFYTGKIHFITFIYVNKAFFHSERMIWISEKSSFFFEKINFVPQVVSYSACLCIFERVISY